MQRKLTGVPPLTFVSNGENLADYRIYGASGGVGDRTENLFDYTTATNGYHLGVSGQMVNVASWCVSDFIKIDTNSEYTICNAGIGSSPTYHCIYDENRRFLRSIQSGTNVILNTGDNGEYVRLSVRKVQNEYLSTMLIKGTIVPDQYIPYGCKIPIVCGGATTNIYLNEPLGENESISMNDTGLSIPTINGSNTLSVNTEVQPSSVYVKYATNERSVPARTYLQGVEKMDNWAIYNYINREGSGALKNESTVTSTTVEVRNTIQVTGAASGGTGSYQYAFYHKRSNAENWTTKSDYGAATTVEFSPYYVDTYKFKVNVKDSKGTIKSKIFNINVTAAASTTSNMPSLDKLSFENTDEPTVESDFNRADLTVEDNTPEEV